MDIDFEISLIRNSNGKLRTVHVCKPNVFNVSFRLKTRFVLKMLETD